ncbi:hypothetical protein AGMMS50233_07930 [Endomicrobiia bacterium]|nr:hypothetical protein AGMMS50233_07930 [Endomicrobiia bacterium]
MEEALSTIVIPAEAGIYLTWILAFASITNKKTSRLVVFEISDRRGITEMRLKRQKLTDKDSIS